MGAGAIDVLSDVAAAALGPAVRAIPRLEFCMVDHTWSLPRAASWTQPRSNPLAARLPTLRATLEHERDFRRDQLAQRHPHERTVSAVDHPVARHHKAASALREVDTLIAAGARQALNDIELALARMHTGRYGYCRTCGLRIPLVVLDAIPKTTLCLACQGQTEKREIPSPGSSRRRPHSAGAPAPEAPRRQ